MLERGLPRGLRSLSGQDWGRARLERICQQDQIRQVTAGPRSQQNMIVNRISREDSYNRLPHFKARPPEIFWLPQTAAIGFPGASQNFWGGGALLSIAPYTNATGLPKEL